MRKTLWCLLVIFLHGPVNGAGTGMQIFIRLLSGTMLILDVDTSDTIENVKQKVEAKLPVPVVQQRLLLGSTLLENGRTLADYNIQREAELTLGIDYEPVIYVSKTADGSNTGLSWADAFTDLQSALLMAQAGDQIWVAAGTYYPDEGPSQTNDNQDASFVIPSGVVVYGGFPTSGNPGLPSRNWQTNPTILSGDLMQNDGSNFTDYADNSYTVVKISYVSNQTELNGLVIRGGNGGENKNGGGIYNNGSGSGRQSNPTLVNCSFIENQARNGAAVFNDGRQGNSSPTFLNCIFRNNQATRDGGALYNFGGYSGNSSPSLTNCLIANNKALRLAGGIFNDAVDDIGGTSSPTITNCTFALNQADFGAGALYSDGRNGGVSTPTLRNSIVSGAGIQIDNNSASPSIANSLLAPTDPLFVDATGGDFRLKVCSPGVNTGDNGFVAVLVDLLGNTRIQQTTVDMGAYESSAGQLSATISGGGTYCQPFAGGVKFTGTGGTKPYTFTYVISGFPIDLTLTTSDDKDFAAIGFDSSFEGTVSSTLKKVRDADGCEVNITSNNTATIVILANPTETASSNAPICAGTPLQLAASGGAAWSWRGPNGFTSSEQNPTRSLSTVAMGGVYSVTISSSNGCTQVATTQVEINNVSGLQVSSNSPLCVGSSLRLSVTGTSPNTTYSWQASVPFSSTLQNPTRSNSTIAMSGTYSVTARSGNCTAVATTSVVVSPNVAPSITSLRFNNLVPNAQNTVAACSNAPVTLNIAATNAVTYSWRGPTGAGTGFASSLASPVNLPISTPRQGQYTVTVRNGCAVFNQRVINLQLVSCTSSRLASVEATEVQIRAYPNPVSSQLFIELSLPQPKPVKLKLYDSVGSRVFGWESGEEQAKHYLSIDAEHWSTGLYLIEVEVDNQRTTKRIIKH